MTTVALLPRLQHLVVVDEVYKNNVLWLETAYDAELTKVEFTLTSGAVQRKQVVVLLAASSATLTASHPLSKCSSLWAC